MILPNLAISVEMCTHEIDVREGETLVVNPGEAGGWVTGRSTVGVLDIECMEVEIVDL